MIPFAKGHGLGNDYLVMDEADLAGRPLSTAAIVRLGWEGGVGVGAYGLHLFERQGWA